MLERIYMQNVNRSKWLHTYIALYFIIVQFQRFSRRNKSTQVYGMTDVP